jgi:malate synthase
MADRGTIDMKKHWMDNYVKRIIKVCHSHGAFAMGGMSAFTPGKDAETRKEQTDKVIADKSYEAFIGHDGCWVSHPYFIEYAMKSFSKKNQLDVMLDEFDKYPDLAPQGGTPRTIAGLRTNIRVGIAYMQGWNTGNGCVSWDNLMEDLATLEISRAQVWQWLFHQVKTDDGEKVTCELVSKLFKEELDKICEEVKDNMITADEEAVKRAIASFEKAKIDAENIFLSKHFNEFLFTQNELV